MAQVRLTERVELFLLPQHQQQQQHEDEEDHEPWQEYWMSSVLRCSKVREDPWILQLYSQVLYSALGVISI